MYVCACVCMCVCVYIRFSLFINPDFYPAASMERPVNLTEDTHEIHKPIKSEPSYNQEVASVISPQRAYSE